MTRRRRRPAAALIAALILTSTLGSCARKFGWGVVLWSSSEGPLAAGTLVPIYIKSNIESLYVVGVPGSDKKVELPLWQVEVFSSKTKAQARVKELGSNASLYLAATRDGLPVREEPNNLAKRVYRLREAESVKVLGKVEGEKVTTGDEALTGEWYQVLAEGGAVGYVFSNTMRLYDETKEGPPVAAVAPSLDSARVDIIFTRSWKPAYFQEMIDEDRVDLDYFSLGYGLFTDAVGKQIRLALPGVSRVFNYSSIAQEGAAFSFADTPLRIKFIAGDRGLEVSWNATDAGSDSAAAAAPGAGTDPGAPAPGEPATPTVSSSGYGGRASFVVPSEDPRQVIRREELRQQKLLEAFVDTTGGSWILPRGAEPPAAADPGGEGQPAAPVEAAPAAPSAAAPAAAAPGPACRLTIAKSRRFTWAGRESLPVGFLPPGIGDTGDAAFRLRLAPAVAAGWDGAFTLRFDIPVVPGVKPATDKPQRVNFVYKLSSDGIVLAQALLDESLAGGESGILVTGTDSRFEALVLKRKD